MVVGVAALVGAAASSSLHSDEIDLRTGRGGGVERAAGGQLSCLASLASSCPAVIFVPCACSHSAVYPFLLFIDATACGISLPSPLDTSALGNPHQGARADLLGGLRSLVVWPD